MWQSIVLSSFCALTTLVSLIGGILYLYMIKKYKFWSKRGIPGPKPALIYGNFKHAANLKSTESENVYSISLEYKNEKYVGIYHFWQPALLVKDIELVKRITIKDFDYFVDHPPITGHSRADDPLNSLFTMEGAVWRSRRQVFSKMFTPKKLREYAVDMQEALKYFLDKLEAKAQNDEDIELLALSLPYSVHSFTSSFYGLELTKDEERTTQLIEMINEFIKPPASTVIKFLGYSVHPEILNLINVSTLTPMHYETTSKLMDELLSTRKSQDSGRERNDLFQIIMGLMTEGAKEFPKIDYGEAIGHTSSFLQAASNTTQVTLSHTLHRLALHKDVQEKVREEVESIIQSGQKQIQYDDTLKMTYLHNVIRETMRLSPLLGVQKRIATRDYKVDERLTIPKGMNVFLDTTYIQRDPELFRDPDEFMPDRWALGENDQAAFLAFGKGPRICIGQRFSELELKMAIASIITKYTIHESDKMVFPMNFDPKTIFITNIPLDGIWIKLKPRV